MDKAMVPAKTYYTDMFKNCGKYGNQERRRNEILIRQKSNRVNDVDRSRGHRQLVANTTGHLYGNTPMELVPGLLINTKGGKMLMSSEWMVQPPAHLDKDWYMAPCPKGKRTLVISCNGTTKFYTKYGWLLFSTATELPGGNLFMGKRERSREGAVLDCLYNKDINKMYVLDILMWNGHVMANCELEFRNYWLKSKFEEHPELGTFSPRNKVIFGLLNMTPCLRNTMIKSLMTYPKFQDSDLDGFLFYHRKGRYVADETPLVGWLYPYMVPEVLYPGVSMHPLYEARKPRNYSNISSFVEQFEERRSRRMSYNRFNTTANAPDDETGDEDTAWGHSSGAEAASAEASAAMENIADGNFIDDIDERYIDTSTAEEADADSRITCDSLQFLFDLIKR